MSTGWSCSAQHSHLPTTAHRYSVGAWHNAHTSFLSFLTFVGSVGASAFLTDMSVFAIRGLRAADTSIPSVTRVFALGIRSDLGLPLCVTVRVLAPMGLSQYSLRSSNWVWSVSNRSRRSPTCTQMVECNNTGVVTGQRSSSDLRWGKANEAAFLYKPHAINQSPEVLTFLTALAAPNLNWIPPMTLVSQLSLETTKLPEMT